MISNWSMDDLSSSDLAFAHVKPLHAPSGGIIFNRDVLDDLRGRTSNFSTSNSSLGFMTMDSHRLNDYTRSICSMTSQSPGATGVGRAYHPSLSRSLAPSMIKTEDPFLHSGIIPDCSPGNGEPFIFHNFPAAAGNFTAMLNEGESSSGGACGLPNIQTMINHPREGDDVGCGGSFLVPSSPIMSSYGILSNQSVYIASSSSYMPNFSNVLPMNFSERIMKHPMSLNERIRKHEPTSSVGSLIAVSTDMNEFRDVASKNPKVEKSLECHSGEFISGGHWDEGKRIKEAAGKNSLARVRRTKNNVRSCFSDSSSALLCDFKAKKNNSSSSLKSNLKIFESDVVAEKVDGAKGRYGRLNGLPVEGKENQVATGEVTNTFIGNGASLDHTDRPMDLHDPSQYLSVECDNISNDMDGEDEIMDNGKIGKPGPNDSSTLGWPEVDFSESIADPVVDNAADLLNSRMFTDKLDVSVHVEECQCIIVDGTKRWRCLQCPKMYSTKHNLIIHILGHSGIKPHCCNICNKYFKQVSHLQTHMLIHGNVKPHICHICHRTFTQASHVKRHMAVHMERRSHVCTLCNRSFAYQSELKAHAERHKLDCENVCDECGASFDCAEQLRKHKTSEHKTMTDNRDSGPPLLSCKVCSKSFMYPSQLRDHSAKHDGTRPFICGECGMDFMKEHHLKSHMFTHTGLRPFQCKECAKAFNQKANLQRHQLIHNGEKRFACEVCGRGFTQHQILRAHLVTHQETKPFQCKFCGKGFSRLHNLNGHMLMHEGGKPFTCTCGASFTLKGNLNRHKRDKHGQIVKDIDDDARIKTDDTPTLLTQSTTVQVQPTNILNGHSVSMKSTEDDLGNLGDRSPATPKKKRKSMPRKTALEASECETDEVDEVKAAWRLTSEEDNMMEDGLSGEDEEEEEDGEMMSGIDGGGMISGEQQPARLLEILSASSCSSIDDENGSGEGKLLCTLQPVGFDVICTKDEDTVLQSTHGMDMGIHADQGRS